MAFSAPGPPWVMTTPNVFRLLSRLKPSAAISAPRSWRNIRGRMPSWATASIRLLDGKHPIHSMPSVFRMCAMACSVFAPCQGPLV